MVHSFKLLSQFISFVLTKPFPVDPVGSIFVRKYQTQLQFLPAGMFDVSNASTEFSSQGRFAQKPYITCSRYIGLFFPDSSVGKESAYNAGDHGQIPGSGRSAGEGIGYPLQYSWASLVAQLAKNPPAMWETWVLSLGWEDPLEKGKATHSSILAWRIPWTIYSPWGCKELDRTERLSLSFLEKEVATHSNILAWRIPWSEEPSRLQSMDSNESDTTQGPNHHHFPFRLAMFQT